MARPRLVHEGLPIGTCVSPNDDNNNNNKEDIMMLEDISPSSTKHTSKSKSTSSSSSSLLNALGRTNGSIPRIQKRENQQKAHASHLVIGADRQMKTAQEEEKDIITTSKTTHWMKDPYPKQQHRFLSQNIPNHVNHSFRQYGASNDLSQPYNPVYSHTTTPQQQQQHISHSTNIPSQYPMHLETFHPHGYAQQETTVSNWISPQNTLLNNNNNTEFVSHQHEYHNPSHRPTATVTTSRTRTHIQIGKDERPTECMEGVEDHSIKPPLIVLDGANVAHAYGKVLHSRLSSSKFTEVQPNQPDARGILVACEYFARAQLRVLVVLPAHWFQKKNTTSYIMTNTCTNNDEYLQKVIEELDYQGILVPAPPTDDDDAYAITIAQRENIRAMHNHRHGPGYVLSNDLFRDAQQRDPTGKLKTWLTQGLSSSHHHHHEASLSLAVAATELGPGRISYTFCDMGRIDDNGERELDFIPNPRHPLIEWIERQEISGP